MKTRKPHEWHVTEADIWEGMVIRALKRDAPNGGNGWRSHIEQLARDIESGAIVITFTRKNRAHDHHR